MHFFLQDFTRKIHNWKIKEIVNACCYPWFWLGCLMANIVPLLMFQPHSSEVNLCFLFFLISTRRYQEPSGVVRVAKTNWELNQELCNPYHSVQLGHQPPLKNTTPLFLSSLPLNLQTVQAPLFREFPLYIGFCEPHQQKGGPSRKGGGCTLCIYNVFTHWPTLL